MAFINKISNSTTPITQTQTQKPSTDFAQILKKELEDTNALLKASEKAQEEIATGEVEDLAQATITIQKAEMKMKMMLEVRNKAINAYKELLRTQI